MLAWLQESGVNFSVLKNQLHRSDFRTGARLGAGDRLVLWAKPARPDWLAPEWFDPQWFDPQWFDPQWFDPQWFDPQWFDPQWFDPGWFGQETDDHRPAILYM
jgi:hypothetical protein